MQTVQKAFTDAGGAMSWLIGMTAKSAMRRLASALRLGSSLTHGAHQVAHRFTSVGTPRSDS